MKTHPETYEEPFIKVLKFEFQTIICGSGNTEDILPGDDDIPWDE